MLAFLAHPLLAHSDPPGDVYPNVKVERGNFVIDFTNNQREDIPNRSAAGMFHSPLLRMIYSPSGVLLAPRHLHGGTRELDDDLGYPAKTEATIGNEKITFERTSCYSIEKEGRTELHRLPWPEGYNGRFEAFAADADSICVAGIVERKLFLHHFDRHRFRLPQTVQVTEPGTLSFIWDFPVVSNLVFAGGRYCIAWPRYKKDVGYECVISTWKPGEDRPREIVLEEPADWNSHLSLAAIGDRLCLAYHTLTGEYQPVSKIITVFRTISRD